ncbi:MAG: hemerythrin domain-containing protein [Vulcanimicrobiaceae bacterium]
MDAITLLKKDHAEVKAMFKEVEELGERATSSRQKLFRQIDEALTVHAQVEEQIFYPRFKERAEDAEEREEVLEAYEEHALVKKLIGELEKMEPSNEAYKAKLKVLKDLVDHHVKEEEGTLFKMAREIFEKEELNELGQELEEAKQQAGVPA